MPEAEVQNTETSSIQEPVAKTGGESITSFDELDSVDAYQARESEHKASTEPKTEKKDEKPEPKKAEKSEKLDKKASKEEEEKTSEETKVEEEAGEELPAARTFKLKNGNDEVELRADTIIPVKVDGEDRDMPFEEVVRRASGDVAIETRFNQLHQEKQSFEADKQVMDQFVQEVYEAASEDPIKGLLKAVEKAGMNPIEYEQNLLDAMARRGKEWEEMSEEQREIYKLQREKEAYEARQAKHTQQQNNQAQVQEVQNQVEQIKQQHGIEHEEMVAGYQDLLVEWNQGAIPGEITPELVADYVLDQRKIGEATEILNSVDPKILAENSDAVDKLVDQMYTYPQLDGEDLKEIVREYYKVKKPATEISQKLKSGKPDRVEPGTINPDKEDLFSFDQLDGRY